MSGDEGILSRIIGFCLERKLVVALGVIAFVVAGMAVAPFDWQTGGLTRDPIPVDAIPDIGENQQIVFTPWPGRSPKDVEDQITYPLTVALLGIPEVKTVRSYSMFGFSTIYVIFKAPPLLAIGGGRGEFYWCRSRVLEKLSSLPAGTLPDGIRPSLGPDATALGQVYWYTLEGRDESGNPAGGWGLDELRSVQDWQVRYALMSAEGVSEVASIGGHVREYQIDVDPDAMIAHGVTLAQVAGAVRKSNVDVGARTIELNRVEYVVRGLGFIRSLDDIRNTVVRAVDDVPIYIKDVARVSIGPAPRRGALDKEGTEAVGGVVVVRYGENPLAAIKNVKAKIAEIAESLPEKTLPDGRVSKVTIVPFYDRTGLINETLDTLKRALTEEILVTIIVVIFMVMHLRSSFLISALLPLAVLMTFIAMKIFGVDANIVALSGIAIAIGTMVDMGIVVCENILRHLQEAPDDEDSLAVVRRASAEVGGAVLTAILTTVVSFLPIFVMTGAEGKLFKPLAFTKTFALLASVTVALLVIPAAAHLLFRLPKGFYRKLLGAIVAVGGLVVGVLSGWWAAAIVAFHLAGWLILEGYISDARRRRIIRTANVLAIVTFVVILTRHWMPLGPDAGMPKSVAFVAAGIAAVLGSFWLFARYYGHILGWCLDWKPVFLVAPLLLIAAGLYVWLGPGYVLGDSSSRLPQSWVRTYKGNEFADLADDDRGAAGYLRWAITNDWDGRGREFIPPLDEGSYLFMPTTMPHASIGESLDILQAQDIAIRAIPEVDTVVGKIGRVDSALDPAPVSMIETVVTYKPEYRTEPDGTRVRQWRDHIRRPDDIWTEIEKAGRVLGSTGAPRLQPIATRLVMLQSGMRAAMGVKVKAGDLESLEEATLLIEAELKRVPSVNAPAVFADRVVGKPYLEIHLDREKLARYGIRVADVQGVIEVALGGKRLTTTVEGRERYGVRVRYARELRDTPETLGAILVPSAGGNGAQVPLRQLARVEYRRGPMVIKGEDTYLVGYVTFDKRPGIAEVDAVEDAREHLLAAIESKRLRLPDGVTYAFAGNYENTLRSNRTLLMVVPAALLVILMILYLHFRSITTAGIVFGAVFVAWSGGFIMLWLYGQPWFLDISVFGASMRELFSVHTVNLSVAVWVGFLALFGIASDDGVVMATYLGQSFDRKRPSTVDEIRAATVEAGLRRIRPCLMTTATTILALVPVLTSTGRGADVMVPMAIPVFGGMVVEIVTMLVVPVLYCLVAEIRAGSAPPPPPPTRESVTTPPNLPPGPDSETPRVHRTSWPSRRQPRR